MNTVYIDPGTNEPGMIQIAIDSLGEAGGTVRLQKGTHLSWPIELKSNIHLYFEMGAELIFSNDLSKYKPVKTRWEGTECFALQSQIFASNCKNVKISGKGIISGQGEKWWKYYREMRQGITHPEVKSIQKILNPLNENIKGGSGGGGRETGFLRPSLVQFSNCQNVKISDVTLKDSPFWNTHILYSDRITITNVTFENPENAPNTDGLDIDSSSNVLVQDCTFNVGDDCLCLKSGMDDDGIKVGLPTSNVTIRDCVMNKGHGGIVIGSETSGGIHNVTVESCKMYGTDRGIRVKTRRGRGGTVDNIILKDIEMENVTSPIVMNMYYRCGADEDKLNQLKSLKVPHKIDDITTPHIRNIKISNIKAYNIGSSAAFFLGLPESPIEGIEIRDFRATSNSAKHFEAPAMDLFNCEAENHGILYKFTKETCFESISIQGHEGPLFRELDLEENND